MVGGDYKNSGGMFGWRVWPSFFTWMATGDGFLYLCRLQHDIFSARELLVPGCPYRRLCICMAPYFLLDSAAAHLHSQCWSIWECQTASQCQGCSELQRLLQILVLMGALITIMFAGAPANSGIPDYNNLMYLSVNAVIGFAGLFCLAMRNVSRIENHKRLMLFATIFILPPGINRLYMVVWELGEAPVLWTYLTMDLLVAAILVNDCRNAALGKVSPISYSGRSPHLLRHRPHLLHPLMASSGMYHQDVALPAAYRV